MSNKVHCQNLNTQGADLDPSLTPWDEEADVVVIGTGFAGLAAAIEAKLSGCSVLILEKMGHCGGNSAISDGAMAAAGTSMQEDREIVDSAEIMLADMLAAGAGLNHPQLTKILAEKSSEVLSWVINYLGVEFQERLDQFGGHSVARSLTTKNHSGLVIVKSLLEKAKLIGVKFQNRVCLEQIMLDDDRSVIGVHVRVGYTFPDNNSGSVKTIKAKKAVVLATGGFGNDVSFRTLQDHRLCAKVDSTNVVSATAEGLKEAVRIGALPVQLSSIQLGPWTSPDEKGFGIGPDFASYAAFPYGVLINPLDGKRFANEMGNRKQRADAVLAIGQPCLAVADRNGVSCSGYSIEHCLKKGVVKEFDTLEDIAAFYAVPRTALQHTIDQFNCYVQDGLDPDYGKPILPTAVPLSKPPFYVMRIWPKVHHTMGGVLINKEAQVLDADKNPIRGFYAAGEVTGGIHGGCRLGSCAITDCLVFGRIAGRCAAADS